MPKELDFDIPDYRVIEQDEKEKQERETCTDGHFLTLFHNPFTILKGEKE